VEKYKELSKLFSQKEMKANRNKKI